MMKKTEPPDLSFPYARRTTSPGPGKAMTSRQRSALFVVLTSVVACADTGDSSGDCAGTVGDSAGIRVVQNPAEGLWSPEVGEALLDLIVEMAGKELRANAAWLQEKVATGKAIKRIEDSIERGQPVALVHGS